MLLDWIVVRPAAVENPSPCKTQVRQKARVEQVV